MASMDKPSAPLSFDYSRIPGMPASVFVAPLRKPTGLSDDWLEPAQRKYGLDEHRIGGDGGRPPFAALQHRRLVMFADGLVATLAVIVRRFRLALLPAQAVELHRNPRTQP